MITPICFMQTHGMHITTQVADSLYEYAITLAQTGQKLMNFKIPDVAEGVLTTQFQTVAFVENAGIQFSARIESGPRTFDISFIIDERYLKEAMPGIWIKLYPIEHARNNHLVN